MSETALKEVQKAQAINSIVFQAKRLGVDVGEYGCCVSFKISDDWYGCVVFRPDTKETGYQAANPRLQHLTEFYGNYPELLEVISKI